MKLHRWRPPAEDTEEQTGSLIRANQCVAGRGRFATAVGDHSNVRGQQRHQLREIPLHTGIQKPLDSLFHRFRLDRKAGAALHEPLACPVTDLATVRRRTVHDGSDLGKGVAEDLMQQKHRPVERGEVFQKHQESRRQRIIQFSQPRRIIFRGLQQGFGQPRADIFLALDVGQAKLINTQPGHNRHQV